MNQMIILSCSVIITAFSLYRLLPLLACRLDGQLSQVSKLKQQITEKKATKPKKSRVPLNAFLSKLRDQLNQAGYTSPKAVNIYVAGQYGLPFLIFILGLSRQKSMWLALALLLFVLVNGWLQKRIRKRQKAFDKSLYKIYRFLDEQISSGVSVTDALRGLYETVRDPIVHPVLVKFTALYEMTLDFDLAFSVIEQNFGKRESDLLAAQIKQCLQTGIVGKSMVRLEELYFTRAFVLMQEETNRIKTQLTLVAFCGLVPLLVLYVYPLMQGAVVAVQSIFS
ncbi:MAG: hypothetical protein KBG64_08590 [Clostridia bacterium]|nr:hypothetical protein [Clostridia bacterium]